MIRPVSKTRNFHFVSNFQIFKGASAETMQPFGAPVAAAHEARLIIRDDQEKTASTAMYAIHGRSENRILQIIEAPERAVIAFKPRRMMGTRLPMPLAA
jgi:hypothetical protein